MLDNIFSDLLGNAREQANRMHEELAKIRLEENYKGVKVVADGNGHIIDLQIDDSLLSEDKEMLQDIIVLALNKINDKAEAEKRKYSEKMSQDLLGGIGGMFN